MDDVEAISDPTPAPVYRGVGCKSSDAESWRYDPAAGRAA